MSKSELIKKLSPTEVENIVNNLLNTLPDRSREVIIKRFGLQKGQKGQTLENIGKEYGITRERVRQIENSAKKIILNTDEFLKHSKNAITEIKKALDSYGGVVAERDFLKEFSDNQDYRDNLSFLMHLAEPFEVAKRPDLKDKVWYTDKQSFEAFVKSLDKIYKDMDTNDLLTESEIINKFLDKLKVHTNNKKLLSVDAVKRLISISKQIGSNSLGQWGLAESRNISTKGVKDLAYLVLNKEQRPMHFRDITEEIKEQFGKDVNVATCHNELIKDNRFILVGRGIYGLSEWSGYSGGTVAGVIEEILKKSKKAMTKEEIIEEVLKRKQVRRQTVIINLANKKFRKTKDGRYALAK